MDTIIILEQDLEQHERVKMSLLHLRLPCMYWSHFLTKHLSPKPSPTPCLQGRHWHTCWQQTVGIQKTFWLGVASNWHREWDLAVNPVKSRTFKMAILCTHLTCYFRTINLCCFNKWLSKIFGLCSWLNQQKYFSTNIFPVFGSCSCWARSPDIYLEYKCSAKSDREAMYTSVNNTFYIFHRADL